MLAILLTLVLPDMGAVSQWLDNISPEQYVDVEDNDDGSFTVKWIDN